MKQISISQFRLSLQDLGEITDVTVHGKVIGSWYPRVAKPTGAVDTKEAAQRFVEELGSAETAEQIEAAATRLRGRYRAHDVLSRSNRRK